MYTPKVFYKFHQLRTFGCPLLGPPWKIGNQRKLTFYKYINYYIYQNKADVKKSLWDCY